MSESGEQGNAAADSEEPQVVDFTKETGQPFVLCKIPYGVYDKVVDLIEGSGSPDPRQRPVPPPRKKKQSYSVKGTWTKEEDETLMRIVQEMGPKKWPDISKGMKGRNGKQCRERWMNHLDPNINHGPWSEEEDRMIIEMHRTLGNQWAKMARRMPGRPANKIKNRWNSTLKKQLEQMDPEPVITPPSLPSRRLKKRKTTVDDSPAGMLGRDDELTPVRRRKTLDEEEEEDVSPMDRLDCIPPGISVPGVPVFPKPSSFYYSLPPEFVPPDSLSGSPMTSLLGKRRRTPRSRSNPAEPPRKRMKTMAASGLAEPSPSFGMGLGYGLEGSLLGGGTIGNPFPSPCNLERLNKSPRMQDDALLSRDPDPYELLARRNRQVNLSFRDRFGSEEDLDRVSAELGEPTDEHGLEPAGAGDLETDDAPPVVDRVSSRLIFNDASIDSKLGIGVEQTADDSELISLGYERNDKMGSLKLSLVDSAEFASDYGIALASPSRLSVELWTPRVPDAEKKGSLLKINVHPVPDVRGRPGEGEEGGEDDA